MTARSLIDGLAVRIGYCTRTTAALTVVALQDAGTLAVTCSGGTVAITVPLTGIGDDHPTYGAGQFPMYYAKVDIAGLTPGTLYTYTVAKNGNAVSGSFRTMPAAEEDYAFAMSTCEHLAQYSPVPVHQVMRDYCEAQDTPCYFYAHVDDNAYLDTTRFFGYQPAAGQDGLTGLQFSNLSLDPQATGLAWDYCIGYLGYFGLLPSWTYTTRPDRMWWHRNMPLWSQWGDHEVGSNWKRGYGGQGNWYGPPGYSAASDFSPVGNAHADFFAEVAEPLWEALFGQALPPKLGASGQHWGTSYGPVAFAAIDCNTFIDGRHGLAPGTGANSGRQADGTVKAATGDATLPFLGATQIGEILGHYTAAAKPFNILFTSDGLASHNEPWGQWWVADSDDFIRRADSGVLNNAQLNGTTGKLAILKGDTHALHVSSYHSDGTAGGLGGSDYNGKELWEICPGTLNASGTVNTTFQYRIFGERLRAIRCGTGPRARNYHGFVHVTVRASATPQRAEVRLVETTTGQAEVIWSGQWSADVPGNAFMPLAARPRLA